jgi:transcription antitermination factor NusG
MAFAFKPGDRVRVTSGAFKSFGGVVQEANPCEESSALRFDSDAAVVVAINVFGRPVNVELSPEILESADIPPA